MNSETSPVAEQYRLQEWAARIRDCQNLDTVAGAKSSVIIYKHCRGGESE